MKSILLFFSFLYWGQCESQVKNGAISYRVFFDDKEMAEFDVYKAAQEASSKLTYTLNFKGKESDFFLEPSMLNDLAYNYAKAFSGGSVRVYQNLETWDVLYNNSENSTTLKKQEFLILDYIRTDWILTTESKNIDIFLCYKATAIKKVTNEKGSFEFPIIAWYCPQLPFGFGPKGYGGLPGIILELQERNITFGAVDIILNIDDVKIEKPKNGKLISYADFQKIVASRLKDREIEIKKK